jgi:ribonuclease P protein component
MAGEKRPDISDESLPRRERIPLRGDFRRAYDTGQRAAGSLLVVFAVPNGRGHHRLGITATRKVGSAVMRNRVRRRVREAFRRLKRALPGGDGRDLVVNVRERATRADARALAAELSRLLGRLLRPA